jgi:hypothetical protein
VAAAPRVKIFDKSVLVLNRIVLKRAERSLRDGAEGVRKLDKIRITSLACRARDTASCTTCT